MKKIILSSFIVLSLITFSCKSKKKSAEVKKIETIELKNGEFSVIKINGIEEVKNNPTMKFDIENKKISGSSSCNHYGGGYKSEGNNIKFGALMSTKRYCKEFAKIESTFFKSLSSVTHYELKENQILLYDKANTLMIVGELKK